MLWLFKVMLQKVMRRSSSRAPLKNCIAFFLIQLVEPQYNEVLRDWGNVFVIAGVHYKNKQCYNCIVIMLHYAKKN